MSLQGVTPSCCEKGSLGGGMGSGSTSLSEHKKSSAYQSSEALISKVFTKLKNLCKTMGNINTYNEQGMDDVASREKMARKVKNPYLRPKIVEGGTEDEVLVVNKHIRFAKGWNTDNEWIGDKITNKEKGTTRIWLQNPNGVQAKNDFRIFRSELEDVNAYEIDFLALSESTLNNNNHFVRSRLKMLVDYHSPNAKMCVTNTNGYDKDVCYQPGGLFTVAMSKLAGRYAGSGQDKLGRYTWTTFCGKKKSLKIYTFYRVSQDSGNHIGDTTAYVQQYNMLNRQTKKESNPTETRRKIVNPRSAIVEALCRDVQEDIEKGYLVILLGDLNECVKQSKFSIRMEKIGMTNIVKERLVNKNECRTQNRGKRVIDGVWMSYTLVPYITKVGAAPFSVLFDSDHRGIYVDISLKHILDTPEIEFRQVQFRRLQVSIPKRTQLYVEKVQTKWNQHKLKEKIERLNKDYVNMSTKELERDLNQIDKQIGEILAYAEKKCTSVNKNAIHEWSPQLAMAIKDERNCRKKIRNLKRSPLNGDFASRHKDILAEESKLKCLMKQMKEIKSNDAEFRKAHIDELIEEKLYKNPKSTYAGELQKLQHIENQRKEARMIRNTHGIVKNQGIHKVLIPAASEYENIDSDDDIFDMDIMWERLKIKNGKDIQNWIEVEDRNQVENLTLSCMKKHFRQAEGTPLTTDHWSSQLMNEDFIEQIQSENYNKFSHPFCSLLSSTCFLCIIWYVYFRDC